MSNYNLSPIPEWKQQGAIMTPGSEGSCPPEPVDGDNPGGFPSSVSLPDQGDQRHKASGSGADPTPAKPGA